MGELTGNLRQKSLYPRWEVLFAMVLLYVSPFVSNVLPLVALAIFALRVVFNDAKSFAADYALLVPIAPLFSYGGMSLLLYLGLFAALWYFFASKLTAKRLLVVFLVVFNYILLRMPWNYSGFVLCTGQLFMLCVILPQQDSDSAQRSAKLFCLSLIASSVFALALRDAPELVALRGPEVPAFWGSATYRFNGLFEDPNYFMTMIVLAIAMLMLLLDRGYVKLLPFSLGIACLSVVGVMTYSKTFFFAMIILLTIGIVWLFVRKKYLVAIITLALIVIFVANLLMSSSIFMVLLERMAGATNLDDLTTGRSDLFSAYYNVITDGAMNTIFGVGLSASNLGRDPHNIYLEITYYMGLVGLLAFIALFVAILYTLHKGKKTLLSGYLPLLMAMLLHMALHGMYSVISYAVFFFAIISTLIKPRNS